ncbi:hypothetical protein PHMEG_00034022 [Phytophthora megakarya]|uniref:Uncharacterized protein n=1 Tax=Phytophthora megakarya TaxID=4795 RepID=A0A225USD7_9STRA|nr:hypothetical protein PHMEG_00034022 [Phytophthora megakarya]
MVRPKRTQKEGREGDGQEVEGLRRSRRIDGQEPEEQKPLEVIEKEAKALRKAKREAREAEKAAAAAQPVVESAAEGDHVSPEAADPEPGGRKPKPVTAGRTAEGGVNLVESPTSEEKEVVPEPTPSVEVVEILGEDSDSEEKAPVKTEPIEVQGDPEVLSSPSPEIGVSNVETASSEMGAEILRASHSPESRVCVACKHSRLHGMA